MKVIKVIVDRLPETCEDCIYGRIIDDDESQAFKLLDMRWCHARQKMIFDESKIDGRPDWCPLVTVEYVKSFSDKSWLDSDPQ